MRGKRTFSFVTQNSTIFQKKMKLIELVIPPMIAADANGTDRTVNAGSTHVQLTGARVWVTYACPSAAHACCVLCMHGILADAHKRLLDASTRQNRTSDRVLAAGNAQAGRNDGVAESSNTGQADGAYLHWTPARAQGLRFKSRVVNARSGTLENKNKKSRGSSGAPGELD